MNQTKLDKLLAKAANLQPPPATETREALLASVMAKAERVVAGETLAPADWTNAPPVLVAHRNRLLEWLTKRD